MNFNKIEKIIHTGKTNLVLIYILFLCGTVAPILPVIGTINASLNKNTSNTNFKSHYLFLIRTFWIALIINVISIYTLPIFSIGKILYIYITIWYSLRVTNGFIRIVKNKPFK